MALEIYAHIIGDLRRIGTAIVVLKLKYRYNH